MQNKKKKRQLIIAFNKLMAVIHSCTTDAHIIATLVLIHNYKLFFYGFEDADQDCKFFTYKLLNKEKELKEWTNGQ